MIYYPLSVLPDARRNSRDLGDYHGPHEQDGFRRLLKDGAWLGLKISYAITGYPLAASPKLSSSERILYRPGPGCLGFGRQHFLRSWANGTVGNGGRPKKKWRHHFFAYHVRNPEQYGVIEF